MAIPSGSGSEILKSNYQTTLSTTERQFFATTDHNTVTEIATIVSVVFTEMAGADGGLINMWIDCGRATISGTADANVYILRKQPIGEYGTFVFSDKVVLYGGDALKVQMQSSANVDVVASWIIQDWT